MSDMDSDTPTGHGEADAADAKAPVQWIYRNLTPWRIQACFTDAGVLLSRIPAADDEQSSAPPGDQTPAGDANGAVGSTPGAAKELPRPDPRHAAARRHVVKVLSIPALGEVIVPHEDARKMNTLRMRRLGQIDLRPAPHELLMCLPRAILVFGWLTVGLLIGAKALFDGGGHGVPWAYAVAAAVAVPVAALIVATWREITLYLAFGAYRDELQKVDQGHRSLEGVERGSRMRGFVDGIPRHISETIVLVGAIVISVVGLGVAIQTSTQLKEWFPIDYGALVRLQDPVDIPKVASDSVAFWQLLVGYIAQWILVSVAALAPVAMYFQFDRLRLAAVQRRWIQEVFRLDPTVRTVRDVVAKYGSQIESAFGVVGPDSALRLRGGRRSPVIVATILLVVGWFLVIATTNVPTLQQVTHSVGGQTTSELVWPEPTASGEAEGDAVQGGTGDAETSNPDTGGPFPVANFFAPNLTLIGYAFLGAYVFTLLHVIRGYQRRDLHPWTYNTVVVRILSAYAIGLVVSLFADGDVGKAIMFFVGFMPESALVWLREQVAQDSGPLGALPLHEPSPLTELEGIDLYDRTRLAEEGINNVQALAHADIIDLMSSTRISAAQLVDWTDQALLYLRVGGDSLAQVEMRRTVTQRLSAWQRARKAAKAAPGATTPPAASDAAPAGGLAPAGEPLPPPGTPPTIGESTRIAVVRCNLCLLRQYGIRTATDLLEVYNQALRRGNNDLEKKHAEVVALRKALELRSPPDETIRSIQTIIDTLPDEEWFMQVRNWRRSEFGTIDAWYVYLDGNDWTSQKEAVPPHIIDALTPFEAIPMARVSPRQPEATHQLSSSNGKQPPLPAPSTDVQREHGRDRHRPSERCRRTRTVDRRRRHHRRSGWPGSDVANVRNSRRDPARNRRARRRRRRSCGDVLVAGARLWAGSIPRRRQRVHDPRPALGRGDASGSAAGAESARGAPESPCRPGRRRCGRAGQ